MKRFTHFALATFFLALGVSARGGISQPLERDDVHAGTTGRDVPAPPPPARRLRLAILPDRTSGRDWGLPYLDLAVADLNRIVPDAVVSIGDMIQGYTRSPEQWDREAKDYLTRIAPLRMPFYPLAGNHEVISGTRRRDDATYYARYQETFAPLYYAVDFELLTLIMCLSDDPEHPEAEGIGPTQLQWLRARLAQARDRGVPIVVVMHKPLWRSRRSGWFEEVHPLLLEAGVDGVIAGHFHAMQRDRDVDGIPYRIVGTCGGMIDQYPLAGQMQHLSFLIVDEHGGIEVHHQPVGVTMPDDFVVRADQDRVFVLKTTQDAAMVLDAPPDPFHQPFDMDVRVALTNPIDVPLTCTVRLIDSKPEPEWWAGSFWLSRMEQDRFNPFTTRIDTPVRMVENPGPIIIEPGGKVTMALRLSSAVAARPCPPPELEVRATFVDTKGREVPVVIRRRVPFQRAVTIAAKDDGPAWTLSAWDVNLYDTLEPDALVSLVSEGDSILLKVEATDDHPSGYEADKPDLLARAGDPMSDALLIVLRRGPTERKFYVEPFREMTVWELSKPPTLSIIQASVKVGASGKGWNLALRIPKELVEPGEAGPVRLNVGLADNDGDFHTQWRWLAPQGWPAILTLEP